MRVSDFVQASRDSNGVQTKQQLKPVKISRERQADMARISPPPTQLTGFNHPLINRKRRNLSQENTAPYVPLNEPPHVANTNEREGPGDLFDTDLEGVDDSTTIGSVLRETEAGSVTGNPHSTREDTNLPDTDLALKNGGYKSITERIKELDSDDEEDDNEKRSDYQISHRGITELDELAEENINHINRELGSNLDVTNNHSSRETLSWQKIEAILREDSSSPTRKVDDGGICQTSARVAYAPTAKENYENGTVPASLVPQNSHLEVPKITPRPVAQRLSTRNRFAARPHFAAPDPYSGHNEGVDNVIENDSVRQQLQNSVDDQYSTHNRGTFDTATNLSTMDYSDDDGFEEMVHHEEHTSLQSPHLSTVSAASSKRPLSNFISDYPRNILETKSFSDLQAEGFDYNPIPAQPLFQHDTHLSLKDKLLRVKNFTDDQRRAFFSSVTLSEWEECGDLLVEEFCQILQKSKGARQTRRKVAAIFEAEIKRRHDAVEYDGKSIKNRLEDMRAGGIGVLRGKIP
ncbi:hypothetical protein McanMca71_005979 [Microsporum canis]|uniref:Extracellular mutant protein 11 C-terminal domain-containing protein n=1 Tax=Arthroderma otae (strain ATCC MYA-4605 / CBS 113480) TaxID=554155 RepID=C5FG84_ARTOC|nr:conserved hypothetical protein [Microsporum canis CBS 113480]EEQ29769.1 conserved hypothetical protein [Microsporum canis CBS 113480]